jgi:dsDNA-specific endonuclease/ATPase MutS2
MNTSVFEVFSDEFKKEAEKITDREISQSIADKDKKENKGTAKKVRQKKPDIEEVDLHIHEITDDYLKLSDGEILEIQLKRFYSVLEEAINDRNRKIVFIHGVGNGKLKYEIRKALDTKYPGLEYQDASFKDYGFGATLVTI